MKKKMLTFAILALTLGIIIVNVWKPDNKAESTIQQEETNSIEQIGIEPGNIPPDFELTTLTGEQVQLSDYRGKKVILNFWATWCPPCRAEMPHMQAFYEKNKDNDIAILAVNLTNTDKGKASIREFVNEYELTFPIPLDKQGTVGPEYQAYTIPTSYIIDSNGLIQEKVVGPMDEAIMEDLMNSID